MPGVRIRRSGISPGVPSADSGDPALLSEQLLVAIFDDLPATWVIDRVSRIRLANAPAIAAAGAGNLVKVQDDRLVPNIAGGERRFLEWLSALDGRGDFAWPDAAGVDTRLRLKPVDLAAGLFAATLVSCADPASEVAPRLAARLHISDRKAELAAHLLAGCGVTESATRMGIARSTANELLRGLLRRFGVDSRQELIAHLLASYR